jgi:uncharacterized metal-binding protein YceD (DUF177 family)
MTPTSATLTRSFDVDDLPDAGAEVAVDPTVDERASLAAAFGLDGIDSLAGRFLVVRRGRSVTVTGRVTAAVRQISVVSLEPFPATVDEAVNVKFVDDPQQDMDDGEDRRDQQAVLDAPDPIIDGRIDLGQLTAEFLALGLDPYPRQPGETFSYAESDAGEDSPFAALKRLGQPQGE